MKLNTRNQAELDHFKGHSATWWDERGPFFVLHALLPLRLAFIKEKVGVHFQAPDKSSLSLKGLRILDVGCGGGLLCEPLARLGADGTGIDPVKENILIAKRHAKDRGLKISYLPCAVEDLPANTSAFDVIVASEIIEHVDHPEEFLNTCVKHLAPHGGIFMTTLNKTLKSYILGIVAAEYILRWVPRGTHSWEKFIKPEDLVKMLKKLGFGIQEMAGVTFSLSTWRWEFTPSLDVNYFLWGARH